MGNKIKFLIVFVVFLFGAEKVDANTYYVATTGNDNNSGMLNEPWRTINYGVSRLKSGETLYIRGGVYKEYVDRGVASGTSTAPTIISGYPGETVEVDGGGVLPPYPKALWSINSGNYIVIKDLELKNSSYDGLLVTTNQVTVKNIYTHDDWNYGIDAQGDNIVVEDCRAIKTGLINQIGTVSDYPEGIAFTNSNNGIMRRNVAGITYGEGLNVHNSNNILIEDNVSYDGWSVGMYISDSTNVKAQRNMIYYTGYLNNMTNPGPQMGIYLGDEQLNPQSANITVTNNIVYGAKQNFYWNLYSPNGVSTQMGFHVAHNTFVNATGKGNVHFLTPTGNNHTDAYFQNNLVIQENTIPISYVEGAQTGIVFSNNLWSKSVSAAITGQGDIVYGGNILAKTNTYTDPRWYKLISRAVAIDKAALILDVKQDYFLTVRPQGTAADIGAHEYIAEEITSTPTIKPGDANKDNVVDDLDYVIWSNNYNFSGIGTWEKGDFNGDKAVNDLDYVIWTGHYGLP